MFTKFEKKWQDIEQLGFDIMGQAPRFMPMLEGFVLEGKEVANFPKLVALYMYEAGITLAQPDAEILPVAKKAIEQLKSNRISNEQVFTIPEDLLSKKYKGCGNGIVVIEKNTRRVLDIDYTDSKLRPIKTQNISMTNTAGKKIREDDATITYRANFSACQVCLF
jgi:hypothetical protein